MRALLLLWLPFAIALATDASAQFTASFLFDGADLSPGNGVCDVAGRPAGVSQCTLRAAIQEINAAGSGIVTLQGTTFAVTLGEIEVTGQALVMGYGPAVTKIDAGGASRIFAVPAGGALMLQRVALENGSASGLGGAIYGGGGNVALLESAVEGSVAGSGGAIAMVSGGTLGVASSLLRNNEARATVEGSSISGGAGGAIYAVYGAQLVVASSTLTGNVADTDGGAVALGPDARLRLVNSTVSGNRAEGISFAPGRGGGIHVGILASGDLRNSTLTANFASEGGGVELGSRDLTLSLENTIVAGNESGYAGLADCASDGVSLASLGYNLLGEIEPACLASPAAGDQLGVSPLLLPLADRGGLTPTHSPAAASPAIDAGEPAGCSWDADDDPGTPDLPLALDQRGEPRVVDGDGDFIARCDVGSVEYAPEPAAAGEVVALLLSGLAWRRPRRRPAPSHR
jgi:hypothetical protein